MEVLKIRVYCFLRILSHLCKVSFEDLNRFSIDCQPHKETGKQKIFTPVE